jgi:alpha-galactosidase
LLAEGAQGDRDYISVAQATDRLLSDIIDRLRQLNPEILIEFRQPYIGPLMRKYGNMFRAGDCPNDSLSNRVRTLDVRLLGNAAPHSDMVMWHGAEPVESAALQIVNILFAVPQVSVRLDRLPPAHHRMVEFWLSFWTQNKGLLLDGDLKPWHPEAWYPLVEVSNEREQLVAVYAAGTVAELNDPLKERLTVVNGSLADRVILDLAHAAGPGKMQILDCQGQVVAEEDQNLAAGLVLLKIPPAGLAIFEFKRYAGS